MPRPRIKQTIQERLDALDIPIEAKVLKGNVAMFFDAQWAVFGWTVDELLIHPEKAMSFCRSIRKHSHQLLTDDLILRTLMNLRRSGRA